MQKSKIYIRKLRAVGKVTKSITIPKKILTSNNITDNTPLKVYLDDKGRIIIEKC
jgi:bifunctional DNA-binding transcriptional regulator/antitoxin component of YhaV-PrlF toxin-antitoxin module